MITFRPLCNHAQLLLGPDHMHGQSNSIFSSFNCEDLRKSHYYHVHYGTHIAAKNIIGSYVARIQFNSTHTTCFKFHF